MTERRERVQLRDIYKGPMDMDKRVGIDCGSGGGGVDGTGESNEGKTGTTVIEQK